VLNGQNFSLSPDGSRLAVLRGTQVEFYDLPEMSADEQAKYTAVKADVPGLYIPPADTAHAEADDPAFTVSDAEPEGSAKEATALADSAIPSTAPAPSVIGAINQVPAPPAQASPASGVRQLLVLC
jgi:hypothetical protein